MAGDQESSRAPFRFSSSRQDRISKRLALVGPGPASFYKDACRLMTEQPPFASTTHLVGHLLREIESGLREVLATAADETVASGKGKHKRSIQVILKELEIPETHYVAEAWLRLATEDNYGLHTRAHREALSEPRPFNAEFVEFWNEMESILDNVLNKFEDHYLAWHHQIERLAQKDAPTAADVRFLKNRLPNNLVAYGHFFSKLDSPAWLHPLQEEGLFDNPRPPEYDTEKGTVAFGLWPQSRYLVRMAPIVPDQVLTIIQTIPDTDNFRIHVDFAEAALEMPPTMAAKLVPKMTQWISVGQGFVLLPLKLGKLMRALAESGEQAAALVLGRSLLSFIPVNATEEAHHGQPRARIDLWHYEQILTLHYPKVTENVGEPAFAMLCDLLEQAIGLSRFSGEKRRCEDYSANWLSDIEGPSQRGMDSRPYLALAIRDAAEALARKDPGLVPNLVRTLRKKRNTIFRRLAHQILSHFPDAYFSAIERTLLSRGMLNKARSWHEYTLLMHTCFKRLSPGSQDRILGWIDEGPNVYTMKRRYQAFHGRSASDGEVGQWIEAWKRERIAPIAADLPERWRSRFTEYISALEPSDRVDLVNQPTRIFPGRPSPVEGKNLADFSVEDIAHFLERWEPKDDWIGPSRDSLGRDLLFVVSNDPKRFAVDALRFQGLEPIYVQSLIEGLNEALKKGHDFEWRPVLQLLEWAVIRPAGIKDAPIGRNQSEKDCRWTYVAIARLLSTAFQSKAIEIPFIYRYEIWKVLERLTAKSSDNVIAEEEDPEMKSNDGSGNMAADSSEPLIATIWYASWVKKNITDQVKGNEPEPRWFLQMPEVQHVLDSHLDSGPNQSIAVHSVFGEELPRLFELDAAWVSQQLPKIFPADSEKRGLCDGAWSGYIFQWNPSGSLFGLLRADYMRAIQRQSETWSKSRYTQDPAERLAEHLMFLYWWGRLSLQDELLCECFAKSSDKIRGHALHFIGFNLRNGEQPTPATMGRLAALYEARLNEARMATDKEKYQSELAAYGWWFASCKFEARWSISQLIEVLSIAPRLEVDFMVVERLASLGQEMPEECAECMRLLSDGLKDVNEIYGWQEHGRTVLSAAIKSGNAAARGIAIKLINRLESRGYSGFRDLLNGA